MRILIQTNPRRAGRPVPGREARLPASRLAPPRLLRKFLQKAVDVREEEIRAVAWSALQVFCLFMSYYMLRPVRDEIGAQNREDLEKLWTGTFVASLLVIPVYSGIASRFPRQVFLPAIYRFFLASFVVFYLLLSYLDPQAVVWTERVFYVWLSVFNLFVISTFWAFMADHWSSAQGKRLFGVIAVGGTLGAILGTGLVAGWVHSVGKLALFLLAACLLEVAAWCTQRLNRIFRDASGPEADAAGAAADLPLPGNVLSGIRAVFASPYLIGISVYLLFYVFMNTYFYFFQSYAVAETFAGREERVAVFARMELFVQVLVAALQFFAVGRILQRLGVGITLTLLPLITLGGLMLLGWAPTFWSLAVVYVVHRAARFGFAKPAKEVLFTVVGREEKYKSKGFIDLVVYRGGDLGSAWIFDGLRAMMGGITALAFLAAPIAGVWATLSLLLGRRQKQLAAARSATEASARS